MLSTSKMELMNIIKERTDKIKYLKAVEAALKKLRKKLIIYYICIFILGILFLYYATAFCTVYRNFQYFCFYGCLESLAMDLATPFLTCFLLSFLRFFGIKKNIRCLYCSSSFLGSIL